MDKRCGACERPMAYFDDHNECPLGRLAANHCQLDLSRPCEVCKSWLKKTWRKVQKSLLNARAKAVKKGMKY